jgi:hypothetical protein
MVFYERVSFVSVTSPVGGPLPPGITATLISGGVVGSQSRQPADSNEAI